MCRLELESWRSLEDPVVGHQRDAEAERGGGDPTVGVVLALAEGVADAYTLGTESGVGATSSSPECTTSTLAILASSFRSRASPQPRRKAP
jgi:hypothetical protein